MNRSTARARALCDRRQVLSVLTDPSRCAEWSPLPFSLDDCDATRLCSGTTARIRAKLATREISFAIEVDEVTASGLRLHATGALELTVEYRLSSFQEGTDVVAVVQIGPSQGLSGRVLAATAGAMLEAGLWDTVVSRVADAATRAGALEERPPKAQTAW